MLKSFNSSKGILTSSASPQEFQSHKCYFHDSYLISKFCTNKKCTLPLCEKCIPIHVKQHLKEQHILGKENIIPFSSAYDIAIKNLQTIVSTKTQNVTSIRDQLQSTKKQIEDLIQKQFSKIQEHISKRENEIKIITEKFTKIKKGSLKTLIFYFSDEENLKRSTEVLSFEQNSLSQIPLLIQKMKDTLHYFSNQSAKQNSSDFPNPIRSNSQPKHEFSSVKNYSSSLLGTANNNIFHPVPYTFQNKEINQIKAPLKFQSSSDFSSLLKDHKSRLENVRNKNLSFAINYSSENRQSTFDKLGSKSIHNFYSTNNKKDNILTKEQSESRPLQIISKTLNNVPAPVKGLSPKKTDLNSDSKQKLSKIKQKYIGDMSLTKQNIKAQTVIQQLKNQNLMESKNSNKNTPIQELKQTKTQENKSKDLQNKILSRQQIRVNIENRLNQRSASLMAPNNKGRLDLTDTSILHQKKQLFGKEKIEQFTLNKNYQREDSYRRTLITEMEKAPMSSIKKQLRADHSEQHEHPIKKFFQGSPSKLQSLDLRGEKTKNEISNFVLDKKPNEDEQNRKAKIIHRQNLRNELSKKDLMYEEAKKSIKLNEPSSKSDNESRQNSESKRKEGRRFNYLYEVSQNTQIPAIEKT